MSHPWACPRWQVRPRPDAETTTSLRSALGVPHAKRTAAGGSGRLHARQGSGGSSGSIGVAHARHGSNGSSNGSSQLSERSMGGLSEVSEEGATGPAEAYTVEGAVEGGGLQEPLEAGWSLGHGPQPGLHVRSATGETWTSNLEQNYEAVVFVHGFNSPVSEALKRIGQLWTMGEFPAHLKPFVYGWPASRDVGYFSAKAMATDHEQMSEDFTTFVRSLEAAGCRSLHVIVHSLGAALFFSALPKVPAHPTSYRTLPRVPLIRVHILPNLTEGAPYRR